MGRKYLGLHSLDELAMEYAMRSPQDYNSHKFGGDSIEADLLLLHRQMTIRFTEYEVQEAIKKAHQTLKIIAFHPKD
jgi:hypothetical protein